MSGSNAFIGKAYLLVGNGASPEVFARYCEVDQMSGLGRTNSLVDVTTFCSNGNMEYIGGLSDGSEFTFTANYTLTTDESIQDQLIADVEAKITRHFQLQMGDASPAEQVFSFALAMLSWEITPDVRKQNQIKFTGKITGPIVRTF